MLNKSLIQGSLSMLILRLLDEKDMYGYEMIETLRSRSENVFELKAGSLYPLLHTLEANNLVTAYEDDASGKTRKYYHITREGRRISKEKKKSGTLMPQQSPMCSPAGERRRVSENQRKLYLDYIKILE